MVILHSSCRCPDENPVITVIRHGFPGHIPHGELELPVERKPVGNMSFM